MSSYYEKFADGKVVCIDDEIPFEIPAGWEWCRLGNMASYVVDCPHSTPNKANNITDYPCIRTSEIKEGKINWSSMQYLDESNYRIRIARLAPQEGDIVYAREGAYGDAVVLPGTHHFCLGQRTMMLRMVLRESVDYIHKAIISPFVYSQAVKLNREGTTSVGHVNMADIVKFIIPIPPLLEQHRIVEKIGNLMYLVDKYDKNQAKLDDLNTTILEALKKSILKEAIQGKLVPQNSSDEPASVLLEKIAAEKQRLVKNGELKTKDAVTFVIFKGDDNKYYEKTGKGVVDITEEIPFEIPSNWCWTRASSIAQIIMGQSPDGESINSSNGIEFHQGKVHFTDKYLAVAPYFTSAPSKYAEPLSLLLCVRAPVGVANITERRICIGRGLCALNFYKGINLDLMFYFFATFKKYYEDLATGSTFKAISKDIVSDTLIPIPPEQEQIRIIEMIQSLYSKIA